jgi:hypothetical protein
MRRRHLGCGEDDSAQKVTNHGPDLIEPMPAAVDRRCSWPSRHNPDYAAALIPYRRTCTAVLV